jgi:XisI protein
MADLEHYHQSIQRLLTEYVQGRNSGNDEVEIQTIFDKEQDRYQSIYYVQSRYSLLASTWAAASIASGSREVLPA